MAQYRMLQDDVGRLICKYPQCPEAGSHTHEIRVGRWQSQDIGRDWEKVLGNEGADTSNRVSVLSMMSVNIYRISIGSNSIVTFISNLQGESFAQIASALQDSYCEMLRK